MEEQRLKKQLKLRLSSEDINYIKNKAEELGYRTVSAFVIDSTKDFFIINMDLSEYQNLVHEISCIGRNINSLVRRINTDGFYTDNDIEFINVNQKKIIEMVDKEYGRLLKEKKKYLFGKISKKEKQKLIEAFEQAQLPVPKRVLLERVYETKRYEATPAISVKLYRVHR